jgi:predicted nucleotidyltransferase
MTKRELEEKLAARGEELQQMGVVSLALFGSAARDEATMESDLDLLVEFNRAVSVFHFFSVQHRLEEILGVPRVDLVERGAVHPALRERILGEAANVA